MTPQDVPGPIVIEALFPWLAALEPHEPPATEQARRLRDPAPDPGAGELPQAA